MVFLKLAAKGAPKRIGGGLGALVAGPFRSASRCAGFEPFAIRPFVIASPLPSRSNNSAGREGSAAIQVRCSTCEDEGQTSALSD
jgi:hypothetical protein